MTKHRITVIGAGYVGLTTGTGLASLGHAVRIVEIERERFGALSRGTLPIREPGLSALVGPLLMAGRLEFLDSPGDAVAGADIVIVAVPTPPLAGGGADTSIVESVIGRIGPRLTPATPIVIKSTVPPGTTVRLIAETGRTLLANPEFLRAGQAVDDFFDPARIVVGGTDPRSTQMVASLYAPLQAPTVMTDPTSAEMIKYASNAYLATRLSFVNEIANLSTALGADADEVLAGMGSDPRIGRSYLEAGPGFGGSCLPKDTSALIEAGREAGHPMHTARAAMDANRAQRVRLLDRVLEHIEVRRKPTVAIWGLAFKAGTDDTRDSIGVWLAERLLDRGVIVQTFDPLAEPPDDRAHQFADPVEATKDADLLVIMTPVVPATRLGWVREAMRGNAVLDATGTVDAGDVRAHGLSPVGLVAAGARPGASRQSTVDQTDLNAVPADDAALGHG